MTDTSMSTGQEAAPANETAALAKIAEGPAPRVLLSETLHEIALMLVYAGTNGVRLPDELRKKIDTLVNHADVAGYPMFDALRKGR